MTPPWLPQGFSFLSGFPESKRRRRPLVILQACIDESGTKNQDSYFTFAGFIAGAEDWASFSTDWQARLDAEPTLEYFKMREAAGNPSGAFKNWKREDVHEKVRELVGVIKQHAKLAIHCATNLQHFDDVLVSPKLLASPYASPYTWSFSAVLAGVGYEAIDMKAEELEIIFDQHDKYAPVVKRTYPVIKESCDPELSRILPVEPMFRDDHKFLPLQAADMLAWLFRKALNGERCEWEWIATELMPYIPMAEHSSIFTAERMEGIAKLSKEIKVDPAKIEEWRRIWHGR
jgi:hypothetical protein